MRISSVLFFSIISSLGLSLFAAGGTENSKAVNVYSHRHYEADQSLYRNFEEATGIRVNLVQANADELIERMLAEGEKSPADLLITTDAGRLVRAKELGLLQSVRSENLDAAIPNHLRDPEGFWFGLTKRARVIVWDKGIRPEPGISYYSDLARPEMKGKILIRSSSNIYNISLLAAMIADSGEASARQWAAAMVENMARSPQGSDRDQMKALVAGVGEYAVVNSYYVGLLLDSKDKEEIRVGQRIGVLFPNQDAGGTHINISGAGVAAHAPNPENALQLLEYLASVEAQGIFAGQNFEYPVNPEVEPAGQVAAWGTFRESQTNLSALGENADLAVQIFDSVGWR